MRQTSLELSPRAPSPHRNLAASRSEPSSAPAPQSYSKTDAASCRRAGTSLRQVQPLSSGSILALREVTHLIPESRIDAEIDRPLSALPLCQEPLLSR